MVELYFVQQRIRACQRESSTSFNDLVHVAEYSLLDFCEFELRVVLCPWLRQIDHHIARILIEDVVGLHIVHKRIVLSHFIVQKTIDVRKKLVVLHDDLVYELLLAKFAVALA